MRGKVKKRMLVANIEDKLYDQLQVIAFVKKEKISDIINDIVRTYVITNKAFINEEILKIRREND